MKPYPKVAQELIELADFLKQKEKKLQIREKAILDKEKELRNEELRVKDLYLSYQTAIKEVNGRRST